MQETQESLTQSLRRQDPLQEEMAIHCHILDEKVPWTEEPGRLYSPQSCKDTEMTE